MFIKCYIWVNLCEINTVWPHFFAKQIRLHAQVVIWFGTYLFNVSDPVFDVFKGFLIADVVDEHNALWEETIDT